MKSNLIPNLENCSIEEYDNFFESLNKIQSVRFGKSLETNLYVGEMPILPKYQIDLVQKEQYRTNISYF